MNCRARVLEGTTQCWKSECLAQSQQVCHFTRGRHEHGHTGSLVSLWGLHRKVTADCSFR